MELTRSPLGSWLDGKTGREVLKFGTAEFSEVALYSVSSSLFGFSMFKGKLSHKSLCPWLTHTCVITRWVFPAP